MSADRLNAIGVLKRREIEARILLPIVDALAEEFGRERVLDIVRAVIVRIAREQGRELANEQGGATLAHFITATQDWKKGDAYEMDVVEQTDRTYAFNVTRCRYAELYRDLGVPELGTLLSCSRDFSLIEGFNSDITLTRTQTIMEGASHCDFRFAHRKPGDDPPAD